MSPQPLSESQPDETIIDRELVIALIATNVESIEGWTVVDNQITGVTGNRTDHFLVLQAPSGALWGYDYFTNPTGSSIESGPENVSLYAVIAEPMPRVRYVRRPITP